LHESRESRYHVGMLSGCPKTNSYVNTIIAGDQQIRSSRELRLLLEAINLQTKRLEAVHSRGNRAIWSAFAVVGIAQFAAHYFFGRQ